MRWWTMRQLQSKSPRARKKAIDAIQKCNDTVIINQLCILLSDGNEEVCSATQKALIRIGQPAVHRLLLTSLWTSRSGELANKHAKEVLIRMKEIAFNAVLDRFERGEHDHIDDQLDTIEILSKIADTRALDPLIQGLQKTVAELKRRMNATSNHDSDQYIIKLRYNKLYRLCQALAAIGDAKAIDPLIQSILSLPEESRLFFETLDKLRSDWPTTDAVRVWVPSFISALSGQNEVGVSAAIDVLGRIGDRRALDPLIKLVYDASIQPINRDGIARSLKQIDQNWMTSDAARKHASPFLDILRNEDEYPLAGNGRMVALAAQVLGEQGALPSIDYLLARLAKSRSITHERSSTDNEYENREQAEAIRTFHEASISALESFITHHATHLLIKQLQNIADLDDEISIHLPGICSVVPSKNARISQSRLRQLARQELHRRDKAN